MAVDVGAEPIESAVDDAVGGTECGKVTDGVIPIPPPPLFLDIDTEPKGKRDCDEDVPLSTEMALWKLWKDSFVIFGCAEPVVLCAADLAITPQDGDELHFPDDLALEMDHDAASSMVLSDCTNHDVLSMVITDGTDSAPPPIAADTASSANVPPDTVPPVEAVPVFSIGAPSVTVSGPHNESTLRPPINGITDFNSSMETASIGIVSNVATSHCLHSVHSVPVPAPSVRSGPWRFALSVEELQGDDRGHIMPMIKVCCDGTTLPALYHCDEMVSYHQSGRLQTEWCRQIWSDDTGFADAVFMENVDLRFESAAEGLEHYQLAEFKKFLDDKKPVFLNPAIIDGRYIMAIKVRATLMSIDDGRVTIKAVLLKMEMPHYPDFKPFG